MKITLLSTGSRGDVQPYVALAVALKKAGHTPKLALPENFAAFVAAQGIEFHPLRGDWQAVLKSSEGKALMQSGANVVKSIRAIKAIMEPLVEQTGDDSMVAAQDAEMLICHMPLCLFVHAVAQKLNIPLVSAEPPH